MPCDTAHTPLPYHAESTLSSAQVLNKTLSHNTGTGLVRTGTKRSPRLSRSPHGWTSNTPSAVARYLPHPTPAPPYTEGELKVRTRRQGEGGEVQNGYNMAKPLCLTSNVFKDPHLNFAFGGTADFRGRHGVLYNFLSAPGLSVNIKTEEAIFKIHDGALTVNGSFLTEAHVVVRVGAVGGHAGHKATASFWSTELNEHNWGFQVVNGSCGGRPFKFGKHGGKKCFELTMAMEHSSASSPCRIGP